MREILKQLQLILNFLNYDLNKYTNIT
jgi:hypothetical protein